jgi:CRP-like cAMP-binding protein
MMDEKTLRKHREKLDKALAANRDDEAIQLLATLVSAEPTNARWPHKRGDLLRKVGRRAEAVAAYEQAVDVYANSGFIARAIAMAKTVLSLDPSRTDVLQRVDPQAAQQLHRQARPASILPGAIRTVTSSGSSSQQGARGNTSPGGRHPAVLEDEQPPMAAAGTARRHPMVLDEELPEPAREGAGAGRNATVLDDDEPTENVPVVPVGLRASESSEDDLAVVVEVESVPPGHPAAPDAPFEAAPKRHPMVLDEADPVAVSKKHPMVLDDDEPSERPSHPQPTGTSRGAPSRVSAAGGKSASEPSGAARVPAPGAKAAPQPTAAKAAALPAPVETRAVAGKAGADAVPVPAAATRSAAAGPPPLARAAGVPAPAAPVGAGAGRAPAPPPLPSAAARPRAAPPPLPAAPRPRAAPVQNEPALTLDRLSLPPARAEAAANVQSLQEPEPETFTQPSAAELNVVEGPPFAPAEAEATSEDLELGEQVADTSNPAALSAGRGATPPSAAGAAVGPADAAQARASAKLVGAKSATLLGAAPAPRAPVAPLPAKPAAASDGHPSQGSAASPPATASQAKAVTAAAAVKSPVSAAGTKAPSAAAGTKLPVSPAGMKAPTPAAGVKLPAAVAGMKPTAPGAGMKPPSAAARNPSAVVPAVPAADSVASSATPQRISEPGAESRNSQPEQLWADHSGGNELPVAPAAAVEPAARHRGPTMLGAGPKIKPYEPPPDEAELFSRALEAAVELTVAPDQKPNETRFSNAPPGNGIELSTAEVSERPPAALNERQDAVPHPASELTNLPLFPLFAEMPQEALADMISETELIQLSDGDMVIRKGDPGDALYGIVEGSVTIVVPNHPNGLTLAEGDVFGESCLLQDEPRHADVRVIGRLTALKIPRSVLTGALRRYPQLAELMLELLTRRLLSNLLQTSPLFSSFDAQGRRELSRMFEVRRAPTGTKLAIAGKLMDGLYISLTGTLAVETPGQAPRIAAPGSMFGHTLLSREPAASSVTARVNLVVLRLPATALAHMAMEYPTILEQLTELSTNDVVSVSL